MTQDASGPDKAAADTEGQNAAESFGAAQGDVGNYLSNVNSALAAGNPFESKDYLTQQNLATSGAMNSEKDAADQALQQTAARTGTNTAALANEEGNIARTGQRDLTNYNATRDTANEGTWLNQQDKLLGDEATGAGEEAGLYGTSVGGQSADLGSLTKADSAYNELEDQLLGQTANAVGTATGAF